MCVFSNLLYCLEHFHCCTIPGTRWSYAPRRGNWLHCFDDRRFCGVPTNTWITGLERGGCHKLHCLEHSTYSQPKTNLVQSYYSLGRKVGGMIDFSTF